MFAPRALSIALISCAVLAACGGGGSGTTPAASDNTSGTGPLVAAGPLENSGSPDAAPSPGALGYASVTAAFTAQGQTQSFLAYEDNTKKALTVKNTCASDVATVSSAKQTLDSTGVAVTFTITAGNTGGSCVVTVIDSLNRTANVLVGVTITGGTIQ